MVSWLHGRSDLNASASCDLRYPGVSCEMLFACLFPVPNRSLFCAGLCSLSCSETLSLELWSELKINFPGNLVHFEGRLIHRTKKWIICGNYTSESYNCRYIFKGICLSDKSIKKPQLTSWWALCHTTSPPLYRYYIFSKWDLKSPYSWLWTLLFTLCFLSSIKTSCFPGCDLLIVFCWELWISSWRLRGRWRAGASVYPKYTYCSFQTWKSP